jgi:glutamate synthase domain-containing protein 3
VMCNRNSVDLELLADPADLSIISELIDKHFEYTGSPRAKWILENQATLLPKFIKVFPHEYKRVLGVERSALSPRKSAMAAAPAGARSRVANAPEVMHG